MSTFFLKFYKFEKNVNTYCKWSAEVNSTDMLIRFRYCLLGYTNPSSDFGAIIKLSLNFIFKQIVCQGGETKEDTRLILSILLTMTILLSFRTGQNAQDLPNPSPIQTIVRCSTTATEAVLHITR